MDAFLKRLPVVLSKYLFGVSILYVLTEFIFDSLFRSGQMSGIYWYFIFYRISALPLAGLMLVSFLISSLIWNVAPQEKEQRTSQITDTRIIITTILLCLAGFGSIIEQVEPLASYHDDEHTYQIARYSQMSFTSSSNLFICDRFGIFCHSISSSPIFPKAVIITSDMANWLNLKYLISPEEYWTGPTGSLTFSPDGKVLAIGGLFGTITLRDANTGSRIKTLRLNVDEKLLGSLDVPNLAFSPDGKTLASSGLSNKVILWNLATGQPSIQEITASKAVLSFSPDGKILAYSDLTGNIILWDLQTKQSVGQLSLNPPQNVSAIAFSPDSNQVAYQKADITLWDVKLGRPIESLSNSPRGWISSLAFSSDGRFLAAGSSDKSVSLWDASTHQLLSYPFPEPDYTVRSKRVAFSPSGKVLADWGNLGSGIEHYNDIIRLWGTGNKQELGRVHIENSGIENVVFAPDLKSMAIGYTNGTLGVWSINPPGI